MTLKDKTIIITGASSGIGAAAARLFASAGASVVLGARREGRLAACVAEIERAGGRAVHLAGDVTDPGFAAGLVDLAMRRFGRLDAAFNNAGALGELGPIPAMTLDNWNHVVATNLTASFLAARHQVPAMLESGGGSLVFTSSFVGVTVGLPGMGAYAAAKAGLVGLVQVLAAEHGAAGIRANALLPGGTRTEMAGEDPQTRTYIAGLHALKRMAEPDEIAQVALFLVSDGASFMTGSPVFVDGGNSVFKA